MTNRKGDDGFMLFRVVFAMQVVVICLILLGLASFGAALAYLIWYGIQWLPPVPEQAFGTVSHLFC